MEGKIALKLMLETVVMAFVDCELSSCSKCSVPFECNHFHRMEMFMDRDGRFLQGEFLCKPKLSSGIGIEEYFSSVEESELGGILINQIHLSKSLPISGLFKYLNIDKKIILNDFFVDAVITKLDGRVDIALEVTEREISEKYKKKYLENLFRLKKTGIKLISDDAIIEEIDEFQIEVFEGFKFNLNQLLFLSKMNGAEQLGKMEMLKRKGKLIVAEYVSSPWAYELAKGMPFDLFQGHYIQSSFANN